MRESTVNWVAFFFIYETTCNTVEEIRMDIYHGWGFIILVLPSLPRKNNTGENLEDREEKGHKFCSSRVNITFFPYKILGKFLGLM